MQHHQQQINAPKAKIMDLSNFLPLIVSIHADLGPDWVFYQEFLEGVMNAAGRGEDTSAWYEQIEILVGEQACLRFSHEGVCFLLRGLEGKAREGLLPPTDTVPSRSSSTAMQRDKSTENTPFPVSDPNMPPPQLPKAAADTHPKLAANTADHDHEPTFNILRPSGPQSEASNTFEDSIGTAFFTDGTFKRDINNYFYPKDTDDVAPDQPKETPAARDGSEHAPPYFAKDDDLKVWEKRIEEESEVKVDVNGDPSPGNTQRSGSPTPGPGRKLQSPFPSALFGK